jgi:hypothetical protein
MQLTYGGDIDKLSNIMLYASRIGLKPETTPFVSKVVKAVKSKGVSVSHALAEILLCKYLSERGYSCDVEHTIGTLKCDIYARKGSVDECIEIFFYLLPVNEIENWTKYIVSAHIKKFVNAIRSHVKVLSFAYPVGLVPLIPLQLLGPITKEGLVRILASYGLEDVKEFKDVVETPLIQYVYLFDLSKARVVRVSCEKVRSLIMFYKMISAGVVDEEL